MLTGVPALADAEIAAATFADHLARVEAGEQARASGWAFTRLDPLHVVVTMTAVRRNGEADIYHIKLGGEYYDTYPPTTSFVCPPRPADGDRPARTGWEEAPPGSRWLPVVNGLEWLAVHGSYANFADGRTRQLVCCSMTYEYYITGHNPTPGQQWQQGRHTLGATLNRIQDALTSARYEGPAGAIDS
ncbi:hypothetical protein O7630_32760 [Micromonospora sp. WMMD718]|uniref:hypothetical protein n=1 Tax=unclassified Micromonospora TaxID=2617518 RepID=UPI00064C3006|nr:MULTISPECIES: hypothetical protein [unclassified Micromonospora]MDG4755720.1 hypothetical protein [Micromonospora sp. WMMD718]